MQPHLPGTAELGFRRWTIAAVGCVAAVIAGVWLPEQPFLIFAGLVALLYVGTLAVNAKALAWLIIALQPAALIVPFFPGRPFFWELCTLLAWPSLLTHFFLNRQKLGALQFDSNEKRALIALVGYVGVLAVLMFARGVGFRAFGGAQMGGRFYAQQVILAILPLLLISSEFSKRQLLTAICAGWAMSSTYLISDFAFSAGGAMQRLLYFFEIPTDAINFEVGYEVTGMRRYQSFWFVGAALFAAVLTWIPLRDFLKTRAWFGLPLTLGAVTLALSSGHRAAFVQMTLMVLFLSFFQRFWTPLRTIGGLIVAMSLVGALFVFARDLPLPVQRSISFIPGISVDSLARDNAMDTLNDRIEVLKLAINDIPRYSIIGRGFGMERFDLLPGDSAHSGVWLQYTNGYFYNGFIGSVLKMGLPGFLCSAFFIVYISRIAAQIVHLTRARLAEGLDIFDRLALVVCAQWFSFVTYFYCLHGDAGTWAQVFALPAALVMVCRQQLRTAPEPDSLELHQRP